MNRRTFFSYGTVILGSLVAFVLAIPGVAYVVSPLRGRSRQRDYDRLARLSQLTVGVPRAFPIIAERRDAWVKYPREPVGLVWLVRQPEGTNPPVLALTAEC